MRTAKPAATVVCEENRDDRKDERLGWGWGLIVAETIFVVLMRWQFNIRVSQATSHK